MKKLITALVLSVCVNYAYCNEVSLSSSIILEKILETTYKSEGNYDEYTRYEEVTKDRCKDAGTSCFYNAAVERLEKGIFTPAQVLKAMNFIQSKSYSVMVQKLPIPPVLQKLTGKIITQKYYNANGFREIVFTFECVRDNACYYRSVEFIK